MTVGRGVTPCIIQITRTVYVDEASLDCSGFQTYKEVMMSNTIGNIDSLIEKP